MGGGKQCPQTERIWFREKFLYIYIYNKFLLFLLYLWKHHYRIYELTEQYVLLLNAKAILKDHRGIGDTKNCMELAVDELFNRGGYRD